MKRLIAVCISILCLLSLVVAPAHAELDIISISSPPEVLEFSSLEEFLAAHEAVREGTADAELTRKAELTAFAELEEIFFPTAIPESYQIYKILVHSAYVSVYYLHEDHLVSEEAALDAMANLLFFDFCSYRSESNCPMASILQQRKATERDLVNGIYLFEPPRRFTWGAERTFMHMQLPHNMVSSNASDMISLLNVAIMCVETGEMTPYSPPVLQLRCWQKAPAWVQWVLRYICFGWIWMK